MSRQSAPTITDRTRCGPTSVRTARESPGPVGGVRSRTRISLCPHHTRIQLSPILFVRSVEVTNSGTTATTVHLLVALTEQGVPRYLGSCIGDGDRFWLSVFEALRAGGVQDVRILASARPQAMHHAATTVWPHASVHLDVPGLLRSTFDRVPRHDWMALGHDLARIHDAADPADARTAFAALRGTWAPRHPEVVRRWERHLDLLTERATLANPIRQALAAGGLLTTLTTRLDHAVATGPARTEAAILQTANAIGEHLTRGDQPWVRRWGPVRAAFETAFPHH
ncbi:transposase [Rhodococcus sp. NPDC057529]|uniref:transposase n=1 Tax=Rhodococcus sp. NPDC057529 TaxID=3346158 RepID=UPI00366FFD9C